ncbi:MAG: hypothetical protein DCE90_10655 [Pseudanabaena sp.]|nr:MAG: hypothetical protein DCE90_10655 [Pseudanabaena sp.]
MSVSSNFRSKIINENTIFAVTGASGWFGRSTLNLLWELLGEANFYKRVYAFSSKDGAITIENKFTLPTQSLEKIVELKSLDYLFHYAFLTRDRVEHMDIQSYIDINTGITDLIVKRLKQEAIKGVFATSSGAVYNQDYTLVDCDRELTKNPYGALKRREEILLTETCESLEISCLVLRVFSVMGAFMTKPTAYAVGDFVYQALNSQHINILAERPVWRSYTHIQDLVYLGILYLSEPPQLTPMCVDTCGCIVEMDTLARQVLSCLQIDPNSISRNLNLLIEPSRYVGKSTEIDQLSSRLNLHFSPFTKQVLDTITYLKMFWKV